MPRILLNGTRGKSTLVRLLHCALVACGIKAYGRVTGVIPRQLGPDGKSTPILRTNGGHVSEMRWWLDRLPAGARGVVMENSAVSPELQTLAARWLRPDLVVLTNILPDHIETWGPTRAQAAGVLLLGIPDKTTVVALEELLALDGVGEALEAKDCRVVTARRDPAASGDFRQANLALALAACDHLGLPRERTQPALRGLAPDLADFQVIQIGRTELALAFSANDLASTQALFASLGWDREDTRLIYNHRADRWARLSEFARNMFPGNWRQRLIIGARPWPLAKGAQYATASTVEQFIGLLKPGGRVFGCGNVQGLPLRFLIERAGALI